MGSSTHCSLAKRAMSLTFLFIMAFLPIVAKAQTPPESPSPPSTPDNGDASDGQLEDGRAFPLTWQRIIAGVVLLVVGLILAFRGYRHFRFTMFLVGFITGAIIVYSILTNAEPQQRWDNRDTIYVFSSIAGGIVFGLIFWLLHRFTTAILGGLAGLIIALYLLAWRDEGLIRSKGGRIGLMVGASILGLIIGLLFGRRIHILATTIVGSYVAMVGADMLARTGFTESIHKFFTSAEYVPYHLTTNLYIMLGLIAGLALFSFMFQSMCWNYRRQTLIKQNRYSDHDNGWSIVGRKRGTAYQDATPPSANQNNYDNGVTYDNGVADQNMVYSEKRSWNPFKRGKTTVVRNNPEYAQGTAPAVDNRVSYSSGVPLNP